MNMGNGKKGKKMEKTSKTVLLVDDEVAILNNFSYIINRFSMDVVTTESGKEAIKLYKKLKPDYVFLDLGLTDISGLEVLAQIKNLNRNTKVYIFSGFPKNMYIKKAQELGIEEYYYKPVDFNKIKILLKKLNDKT